MSSPRQSLGKRWNALESLSKIKATAAYLSQEIVSPKRIHPTVKALVDAGETAVKAYARVLGFSYQSYL